MKLTSKIVLPAAAGVVGLLIGVGIGASGSATATTPTAAAAPVPTVTTTVPGPTQTVAVPGPTKTVPGPTKTVPGPTVTVTKDATAASADPGGPKENGQYLLGAEIAAGQWRCQSGDSPYWSVETETGDIVDNDLGNGQQSMIAHIGTKGYTVDFDRCDATWVKLK